MVWKKNLGQNDWQIAIKTLVHPFPPVSLLGLILHVFNYVLIKSDDWLCITFGLGKAETS